MAVSKDFIKFRQYIRTQNLKVNEQYLLELFFEYHNTKYNYCFLTFDQLLKMLNTTSKNRISNIIKSLERKGLITVDRTYSNNRYYVVNIEQFINVNSKSKDNKPSISGQVEFELTEEEREVINATDLTQNQAKTLLQLSNNKVDKLISTIQYALKNGANNVYGYVKALLVRGINIETKEEYKQSYYKKSIQFVENCSSREYSDDWYSNIENRLLGWT